MVTKWVKTTIRKGTKTPRICRDMFITNSRGTYGFCEVKNGSVANRMSLTETDAKSMIDQFSLVPTENNIFANCITYRCKDSTKLVNDLLTGQAQKYVVA